MSEKQTKRLRRMAKLFYASQPPAQEKKSVDAIYKSLKTIHGKKNSQTKKTIAGR